MRSEEGFEETGDRPWTQETTAVLAVTSSKSSTSQRKRKVPSTETKRKHRRSRVRGEKANAPRIDSGSEDDEDDDENENFGDDRDNSVNILRQAVHQLRDIIIRKEEVNASERGVQLAEDRKETVSVSEHVKGTEREERREIDVIVNNDFFWTEDFSSFTGQRETYLRNSGPTFASQDPTEIFLQIWDDNIMTRIVSETNRYAHNLIEEFAEPTSPGFPKHLLAWEYITVEELYRYISVLICMSVCQRPKLEEYWQTGVLEMQKFRQIMSRDSFVNITRFLHFVDNDQLPAGSGYDRKISKVAPVLDHCNRKFSELYVPAQHIGLDESLLLWPGHLTLRQCIKSKAARTGIRCLELCESETGYLLQCRLHTGKETAMHPEPLHGFTNKTVKVVLQLLEKYLDVGHVLVIDNWYNQLSFTRYLKSRRTDVLGTISRVRSDIPSAIKDLDPNLMQRGECVSIHSGDIALIAWKDVKIVTVMSSYHDNGMVARRRSGQNVEKPMAVEDYNRYMGAVDLKEHKLSPYLFEKKRGRKWYMKVFRRLLYTSLLNAQVIYSKNSSNRVCTHREFRLQVGEGLLTRFPRIILPPQLVLSRVASHLRLRPGKHYPTNTDVHEPGSFRHKRLRCVRCNALSQRKRTLVVTMCKLCSAALCLGKCWVDYHERVDLSLE